MVPNMFKIAGELTPAVIHVAARTIATHALSIFGDHSDVMHARTTGWAMLAASSVQEAQDFALVAHAATLRARVPFLHFFDGFRTSHELAKIVPLTAEDMAALIDTRRPHRVPPPGYEPRHPRCAGHGPEPRRVLPGPGGVATPITWPSPGSCRRRWTPWRTDRAPVPPGRVPRRARRRAGRSCSWAREPVRRARRSTPWSRTGSGWGW